MKNIYFMNSKKFLLSLVVLLFINLISANGLQLLNYTDKIINKTNGINYPLNLSITNTEPVTFYNVTIENPNIQKVIIPQITSNEVINTTLYITSNTDFNEELKLYGYYLTQVGVSNTQHIVNINFASGINPCDFSITKGDRVVFMNGVSDEIKLKNEDTQQDVTTILMGNNYTMNFDLPASFKYSFYRWGYRINNQVCTISVLNDSGYVNNPEYDYKFRVNVKVGYEQTTLTASNLENNFTLDFLAKAEGVLMIKNTGTKIAKNINLAGEWTAFNKNNFDLLVDEQKIILYTISPIISNTSQTNKTYEKNITISGNFNTVILPVKVFINYAEITTGMTANITNRSTIIDYICELRPDLCNPEPKIVYRDIGNGTHQVNITTQENQFRDFLAYLFTLGDSLNVALNYVKENSQNQTNSNSQIQQQIDSLKQMADQQKVELETNNTNNNFVIFLVFFTIVIGLLGAILFLIIKIKKIKQLDRM